MKFLFLILSVPYLTFPMFKIIYERNLPEENCPTQAQLDAGQRVIMRKYEPYIHSMQKLKEARNKKMRFVIYKEIETSDSITLYDSVYDTLPSED